jgi:hypothetical protein
MKAANFARVMLNERALSEANLYRPLPKKA